MFEQIHPKKLFLIDGIGALLSALMLGIVLTRYESFFGIPVEPLIALSVAACFFALYSLYHVKFFPKNWNSRMKIIALVNLTYCLITVGVLVALNQELTIFGLLYFSVEIIIVSSLAFLELKVSKKTL